MKQHNRLPRRHHRTVLCCALASCLAVAAPTLLAQTAAATLHGQVAGAAAGTVVTARNVDTGAVRRTQAAANGTYTFVGLQPGTYTVEAGPGTAQTVRLSVAADATLNLGAAAAGAPAGGAATTLGTVTVTAALADVKTSEVGSTVSLHQIQTTPQLTRNFLEFADAVPGMVFTTDSSGHASLRGGAQNNSTTNVYIDGVGQKSYVKEGGVSGQFNSFGNPFPQLAIGEYKVITSNYKAEYGQISSAAVTAVTKSGTNDFHGETYFRYTSPGLRAKTIAEDNSGVKGSESPNKEYGFAFGGPIIQDRMHFFLSYEAKRFDIPKNVFPGVQPLPAGVLPADVESQFGPTSLAFKEDLFFGKVDWEVTDRDRLELSAQIRNEHQDDNIGGVNAVSHGIDVVNKDKRYVFRWEHSADNWFNEMLLTHEDAFNAPTPITFGNGQIYTFGPQNDATIIQTGAADPRAAQDKGQKGPAIEDNLTFNNLAWHGDHTIKMGAKYKDITLHAQDASDINPQFYYNVDDTGTADTPYKVFFTKPVTGLGSLAPSVETKAKQLGLYIQDDWAVNDKLTLNLGVRWDYEKNPAYLNFVTPDNVVAALNSQDPNAPAGQTYAQTLANGGIDINDYISTGNNRSAFKGEWQPRFGFSYDMDADQKHVIHGGAGRAYDRDLYDYLQLEVTKTALPQFTVYFRDPVTGACRGDPCYDWDPNYLNGLSTLQPLVQAGNGGEVDMLNNNLKAPYSDQFSLGMSNKVGDWQTDATISRVLSYDGFVFTLGNRYPDGSFFQNGGQPWGNGVPGFGALIIGNNGIETRSTQVLLSAEKPYTKASGWGASFAYTYTNASQNRDINEHYSFDEATIGDYPFLTSNASSKHRIVATGSYDIPWGITLGLKVTLATPIPGNNFICQPPTQPNVGFCVPADATPSGNGRFLVGGKAWGYRSVDFQATKDFPIGDKVTAFARFDVLNLFDFKNYSTLEFINQNGTLQSRYSTNGDWIGVPRTVKLEIGARF
jgi:outer membrane receptor protein involved in Fe transport